MAGRQVKVRAAVKAASVRSLSHAAKAKKRLPLKAEAILPTMKAANPTLTAKMQTVRQSRPDKGLIVPAAIVRTAVAGIGAVEEEGIAEVVPAVAAVPVVEAIEARGVAVVIAAIARRAICH